MSELSINDSELTPTSVMETEELKKWVQVLVVEPTAGTSLSKTERKVFNALLKLAIDQGKVGADGFFRATIPDLGRKLGMNKPPATEFYKEVCLSLMRPVTFTSPTDGEGEKWRARPLVSKIDIDSKKDAGGTLRPTTIYWRFDSDLEPMLLAPERFALLRLDTIARLGSHAAVALYEICARYQGTGSTGLHPWQWWIPVLTGHTPVGKKATKSSTYDEFKYFNARIIKKAVEEINAESEITITADLKTVGRSVTDLRFLISRKSTARPERRSLNVDLIERAGRFEIKQTQIESMLAKFGDAAVKAALDTLEAQLKIRALPENASLEPIKSKAAYVRGILTAGASARQAELFKEAKPELEQQDPQTVQSVSPSQPTIEQAWLAKMRNEIFALPDPEYLKWVDSARQLAVERNNVTALTALRPADALKRRMWTLVETLKAYGPATYGENWQTPPEGWAPDSPPQ